MKHEILETRSAVPLETRDGDDDPLAAATRAVEELRTSVADFETRITGELQAVTGRLEQVETRSARPGTGERTDQQAELERRAFTGFVRHGREALGPEEVRSLRVGEDTAGGYLAPPELVQELLRNVVEFSPIRQAARVGNTSAGEVTIPRRTGRPTAKWVGETEERPGTEPTYGQATIPVGELACYVDVSNKLLEDSSFNIESELAFDFAEEFGRAEGEAFVAGDGNKKPFGIMSNPDIPFTANGNAGGPITSAALITLMYALPAFYRNRGTWLMNGTTIGAVRRMIDGDGRLLWQPSFQAGQPETLLGRPVVEAVDMPDVANGKFPILFGDFQTGFRIYDRIALAVLRDPYSQATHGLTRFHARRRVGAGVVKPEAFRKLKMAA